MRSSPEGAPSWEDALREVIRRYRNGGGGSPPDWVIGSESVAIRVNTGCGDRARLYRSRSGDVWVSAMGCAICHVSAELLNRTAADVPPEELSGIARAVVDTFSSVGEDIGEESRGANGAPDSNGLLASLPPSTADDFAAFLPLRNVPGRRRCATLPWELLLDEPINEDDAP